MNKDTQSKMLNTANKFEYYLENYFNFPLDIKNDIVYLQRALRTHIKVHQMVMEVFEKQKDANPIQKKRIVKEIESEIFAINAECSTLFLRLRRLIDQFSKFLEKSGILVDYKAIHLLIAREVNTLVEDENIIVIPSNVMPRNSEEKLIEKYFEVQQSSECYEILDSDEEASLVIEKSEDTMKNENSITKVDLTNENAQTQSQAMQISKPINQMSLLKPLDQRIVNNAVESTTEHKSSLDEVKKKSLRTSLSSSSSAGDDKLNLETISVGSSDTNSNNDIPVTRPVTNVRMSRLNLRQALKKARTENLAALQRAPVNKDTKTVTTTLTAVSTITTTTTTTQTIKKSSPPPSSSSSSSSLGNSTASTKKTDNKTKSTRNSNGIVVATSKTIELQVSSDDSNLDREQSPPQSSWFHESIENKVLPEDYGQEMFLRLFDLFTPEMHLQMQQRRSKRRRRNVHSNERSDFHYGRFELNATAAAEEKKKRNPSWLSPQPKKRVKRRSADKNDDGNVSRSNSSSPNDKRACNECLKGGGCLEQCTDCDAYYHDSCHHEDDIEKILPDKECYEVDSIKRCPTCKRALHAIVNKGDKIVKVRQEFELKAEQELNRRNSLQKVSKVYKTEMRDIFNIVNVVKYYKGRSGNE